MKNNETETILKLSIKQKLYKIEIEKFIKPQKLMQIGLPK